MRFRLHLRILGKSLESINFMVKMSLLALHSCLNLFPTELHFQVTLDLSLGVIEKKT